MPGKTILRVRTQGKTTLSVRMPGKTIIRVKTPGTTILSFRVWGLAQLLQKVCVTPHNAELTKRQSLKGTKPSLLLNCNHNWYFVLSNIHLLASGPSCCLLLKFQQLITLPPWGVFKIWHQILDLWPRESPLPIFNIIRGGWNFKCQLLCLLGTHPNSDNGFGLCDPKKAPVPFFNIVRGGSKLQVPITPPPWGASKVWHRIRNLWPRESPRTKFQYCPRRFEISSANYSAPLGSSQILTTDSGSVIPRKLPIPNFNIVRGGRNFKCRLLRPLGSHPKFDTGFWIYTLENAATPTFKWLQGVLRKYGCVGGVGKT